MAPSTKLSFAVPGFGPPPPRRGPGGPRPSTAGRPPSGSPGSPGPPPSHSFKRSTRATTPSPTTATHTHAGTAGWTWMEASRASASARARSGLGQSALNLQLRPLLFGQDVGVNEAVQAGQALQETLHVPPEGAVPSPEEGPASSRVWGLVARKARGCKSWKGRSPRSRKTPRSRKGPPGRTRCRSWKG